MRWGCTNQMKKAGPLGDRPCHVAGCVAAAGRLPGFPPSYVLLLTPAEHYSHSSDA